MRRLLAIVLGLSLTSCPGDLDEALRQYGYAPVRPASTFWQPGAIVYIIRAEPLEVGYICTAKQVMGDDYRPMQSATLNADLARATRKAVTFSANYLDMIKGDADLHDVKSIKMSLRNARIFEVNDSDVDSRINKIDPACMRHVRRRLRAGEAVTMISSALQADVVYTVQYDKASKLDSSAQLTMLQNLALKLGVEASALGGRTIEAKDLIWGVRDDRTLVSVFDRRYMEQFDRRNSRLLSEERTPSLMGGYDIWHREPKVLEPCPTPPERVPEEDPAGADDAAPAPNNDPEGVGVVLDDGQNDGQTTAELSRVQPRTPEVDPTPIVAPTGPAGAAGMTGPLDAAIAADANLLRQAAEADGVVFDPAVWGQPTAAPATQATAAGPDSAPDATLPTASATPADGAVTPDGSGSAAADLATDATTGDPAAAATPQPDAGTDSTPAQAHTSEAQPVEETTVAADAAPWAGAGADSVAAQDPAASPNSATPAADDGVAGSEAGWPGVANANANVAPATTATAPPPTQPGGVAPTKAVKKPRPNAGATRSPPPRKGGKRPRPAQERRNSIG